MAVKSAPASLALVTDLNHTRDVLNQTRAVVDKILVELRLARLLLPLMRPAAKIYGHEQCWLKVADGLSSAIATGDFEANGRHLVDADHLSRLADIVDHTKTK